MLISPIYLAGGMRGGWQKRLTESFPEHEFFDPSTHGLENEKEYTAWDLAHIRKAQTVLAYMNADNPSGYGLCTEVGYAHAIGKHIVFVDDCGAQRSRYFGMVRSMAHEIYGCLEDAIKASKSSTNSAEGKE